MKRVAACLSLLAFFSAFGPVRPAGGDEPPSVRYSVPRDFGYFLGDLIQVSYRIQMASDHFLNPALLGGSKQDDEVEVHSARSRDNVNGGRKTVELTVVYQVFFAPESTRTFQIPQRDFSYGPRAARSAYTSRLPAVPVVVSPLAGEGAEFKPPILRTWTSSYPPLLRRTGFAVLLAGVLAWFFTARGRVRKKHPFRAVSRRLSRETDPFTALVLFRRALNEKAGKAIFPHNVGEFFRAFPRAAAEKEEIERLVGLSDDIIFNPRDGAAPEGLVSRVSSLTKRLSRAERWE